MNLRNFFLGLALLSAINSAHAVFTINIVQSGPDVVMTGSGTINTTGIPVFPSGGVCGQSLGVVEAVHICIGTGLLGERYSSAFTTPISGITTGATSLGSTGTGPTISAVVSELYLPVGYVSGSAISNSSTYAGKTLAGMGLTDGAIHTFNLTSGDTFVIRVGSAVLPAAPATPASIPTLSEYAMVALASLMAMLGIAAARRKRD